MKKNLNNANTYFVNRIRHMRLVDLIGISIFFFIVATSFFFFLRRAEYVTVHMRISESDTWNIWDRPPVWYTQLLKPGLEEKDGLGRSIVKIQKVYRYKTNDDNNGIFVDLQVRSVYNKRTNQYSYNGSPLLIGSYQVFKLQGILLTGVIHAIGDGVYPRQQYVLEGYLDARSNDLPLHILSGQVTYTGIPTFIAKKLQPGLNMSDSDGRKVATLAAVRLNPANKLVIHNAREFAIPDPERTNVELQVQIDTDIIDDTPYFKGETRILLGSLLRLDFEDFGVFMTVTSIKKTE